jgi:hypothetical protein
MKKSTIVKIAVAAVVVIAVVAVAMHLGPDFLATVRKHMGMM